MLSELHIENIAVIERADIRFTPGLNVLTGETGAGKSIVIDAIGSVLGERVNRELVRRGAEKGLVTAVFDRGGTEDWLEANEIDSEDELIIQRRIGSDGKSSCRVCGVPVTAAQLKELAALLVDVHGQNDGRLLMDERLHRSYLDRYGEYREELETYARAYAAWQEVNREIDSLSMDEAEKERLGERLQEQIRELEQAELRPGEQEELDARRDLLRNGEKLTEAIDGACESLCDAEESAVNALQNALGFARRAAAIAPELERAVKSLDEADFLLSDAAETLRDFRDSLDFSPEEFDRTETRLALFRRLERRYGRSVEELPAYLDECRKKLEDLRFSDERLDELQREREKLRKKCLAAGEELRERRRETAVLLSGRIVQELRALSMPSVRFAVDFSPLGGEPGFDAHGMDQVRFLMSANAGEEPGRISRIASGGELSRIMLAMKNVFAEKDPVPTLIFDEIDTGVSGVAAQRVGEKLYSVSRGRQVLCVTHLPQIAAMADSQYLIEKKETGGRTYTEVRLLDREGRKAELARLHGGEVVTLTTLAAAQEQLEAAEAYKAEML
ncbi:MAG: DNA repair protein RecN [Oscillospiraceae bacterium]|nr:DNA repair protein RecN [Oscillospiraceae bacterium]